jgi:hypothetical protein
MTDGHSAGGSDRKVRTQIGTQVIETSWCVRNPKRGETEKIENLPESGYKRLFLAAWSKLQATSNLIDPETTPIFTFDPDRYELVDHQDLIVVRNREPESTYGEMVLGEQGDRPGDTVTDQEAGGDD